MVLQDASFDTCKLQLKLASFNMKELIEFSVTSVLTLPS